ncbi:Polycystin-2 [Diplonema papillatum]|nr:Polycystin-2 [Diplonema papillatum]
MSGGSTLLKQDEVEKIRDWAATDYKKKYKLRGKKWDGRVPIEHIIPQFREVITQRERKKEDGKVSKMSEDDINRRLLSIEAGLHQADKEGKGLLPLDDVLRYYSTDPRTRFDIQYVRDRQLAAEDSLGLWVYILFVVLFSFFLVEDRGLGRGYWMNAGLLDKLLDEEFAQSDDLRFKQVYADIQSEEDLWGFVEGPLIESLWTGDGEKANQFVLQANMPLGGIKLRQVRVAPEDCGDHWESLRRNEALRQMPREEIVERTADFNVFCYPDYRIVNVGQPDTETSDDSYKAQFVVHDGQRVKNEDLRCKLDPNCDSGDFPVMYVEEAAIDWATVHDDDRVALSAYRHRTCEELNASVASSFIGKVGRYGCDGYAMVIPFNWEVDRVTGAVDVLKRGIRATQFNAFTQANETVNIPWVDRQTRGIAFELFFHNQNSGLTSYYLFFIELTAAGAFIPLKHTISFKFFDWDAHGAAYYFFFWLYFLWVLGYLVSWFRGIYSHTRTRREQLLLSRDDTWFLWLRALMDSLKGFWIWFDLVNLGLFVAAFAIKFYLQDRGLTRNNLLQNVYYPPEYESVAYLGELATNVNAANALLVYLRVFYFLKMHPKLNVLTKTLDEAGAEIFSILVIFLVVFAAFALMCYVVYGHTDENYRSIPETIISLTLMLLGDFDYVALRDEHRIFTPIFYAMFQILAVFILFNMVIAVLIDAFAVVQSNKYKDLELARELISHQEARWKARDYKVPNALMRNMLVAEVVYQFKWLSLKLRKGCCRLPDEEYAAELKAISDRNPRIYWARLEQSYYDSKKSTNFVDNLQLTPKVLDDYLDDTLGKDAAYFLYDRETGEDGFILRAAKRTRVAPQELVEEMMEYHHEWLKEVSQKTRTGSLADAQEKEQQRAAEREPSKADQYDELFASRFAATPQRRWEEQKAKIDVLNAQLSKIVPDKGDAPPDRCVPCGTKKTDAEHALEAKIAGDVGRRITGLIGESIDAIVDKIMTHDMPDWIREVAETDVADDRPETLSCRQSHASATRKFSVEGDE